MFVKVKHASLLQQSLVCVEKVSKLFAPIIKVCILNPSNQGSILQNFLLVPTCSKLEGLSLSFTVIFTCLARGD